MRRIIETLGFAAAILIFTSAGFAVELLVPSQYSTIQAAINDANDGDVVIVNPNTYPENINFGGKNITVTSTDPNDWSVVAQTIINGGGVDVVVTFAGTEDPNCELAGFTITGGYYDGWGGGIKGNTAEATISKCIVRDNECTQAGGGINDCDGIISDCLIYNNIALAGGGLGACNGTITNCVIYDNTADYVGGLNNCDGDIVNCTVVGNTGDGHGGFAGCDGTITNCIVWANNPDQLYNCATPDYSCIEDWAGGGTGNINEDPNFALEGDWHIMSGSVCIDAGDNTAVPVDVITDIYGNNRFYDDPNTDDTGNGPAPIVDMGAYEYNDQFPCIAVSPPVFHLSEFEGESNPDSQVLSIRNGGEGALQWEITKDCSWLQVDPNAGSSTGEIDEVTLSVDITGLGWGFYDCELMVSDPNAVNSPRIVDVSLWIYAEGQLWVPYQYSTIQAAINAAQPGETVIVAKGTYTGTGNRDLDFGGKAITVRSIDPDAPAVVAATVINCEGIWSDKHRGFKFHNGEEADSVIAGLTITNGYGPGEDVYIGDFSVGGAIFCNASSPTITKCVIRGNYAKFYGGGIHTYGQSNPIISYCTIINNSVTYSGGGLYFRHGMPTVNHCVIAGNSATGLLAMDGNGGGIFCGWADVAAISHCTIANNSADSAGGICAFYNNSSTIISHCIVRDNETGSITGSPIVSYSNIEGGYSGEGNIDENAFFVDAANGDYHLSSNSFCINAGDPCYIPAMDETDIDGEPRVQCGQIDIGADESPYLNQLPLIEITPTEFSFFSYEGNDPQSQTLSIRNASGGQLNWYVAEDCDWLQVDPSSGSSTGEPNEVILSVDASGLQPGEYNCELVITADGATNSPQMVGIVLLISVDGEIHVPIQHPTIQAGINAAQPGETVIVADGTYTGDGNRDLDFGGKAITVRSENGPENCIIDCQSSNGHRGFNFHSGEEADSILEGFTITRGRIEGGSSAKGGGVYCTNASPTIKNCIITNNLAVGCDWCAGNGDGGAAYGAGIYCTSNSNPVITGCTINGNLAKGGKGIDGFISHSGESPPGDGGDGFGAGIYSSPACNLTIVACNITGNTTLGGDAGYPNVWSANGGDACGGGIYGKVLLSNSTITDNLSQGGEPMSYLEGNGYGGGVYCLDNSSIINCLIISNDAYVVGPDADCYGGAIYGGDMTILNSTICNNTAMYPFKGGVSGNGATVITNCIIWGNDDDLDGCSATHSCIEDNDAGVGNIHSNPLFVSGPSGAYYLSQIAAGQGVNSPCVNAGGKTSAYLGMNIFTTRTDKVWDKGMVDMGYHYAGNVADLDDDGDVDLFDFSILASQFQQAPGVPSADIAPDGGDGIVDWLDAKAMLTDNWLWQGSW